MLLTTLLAVFMLQCAKQTGVDYAAVLACTGSSLGNQLLHEMALETENLDPPHKNVPWVVVNRVRRQLDVFYLLLVIWATAICRATVADNLIHSLIHKSFETC